MKSKIGDRVKMSEEFKIPFTRKPNDKVTSDWLIEEVRSGHEEHVKEFCHCEGIVVEYPYGEEFDEVDVKWEPSGLIYAYLPRDLIKI